MNLLPGIEIIEPYPAIYIESLDAIVISDLHLGYEGVMAEYHGLFIPRTQFRKELDVLTKITEIKKAGTIIITGDLKHEFSETTYIEFKEARAMFDEVGAKEKIKTFLIGGLNGKKLIVMPALSPLASGTEINLARREELLSPVLKELVDIDKLKVVGIDEETGSLYFGELGKLSRGFYSKSTF